MAQINESEDSDLNKLAFWMATGSGKTLLMHLNYLQVSYTTICEPLDNILLITPYEGLSDAAHRRPAGVRYLRHRASN